MEKNIMSWHDLSEGLRNRDEDPVGSDDFWPSGSVVF